MCVHLSCWIFIHYSFCHHKNRWFPKATYNAAVGPVCGRPSFFCTSLSPDENPVIQQAGRCLCRYRSQLIQAADSCHILWEMRVPDEISQATTHSLHTALVTSPTAAPPDRLTLVSDGKTPFDNKNNVTNSSWPKRTFPYKNNFPVYLILLHVTFFLILKLEGIIKRPVLKAWRPLRGLERRSWGASQRNPPSSAQGHTKQD